MHCLNKEGLLAVGTISPNRFQNYPLNATKDLEQEGRGAMDYRTNKNTGIIITKWVENKILYLTSNYVGIKPITSVHRWRKIDICCIQVLCPQIVGIVIK